MITFSKRKLHHRLVSLFVYWMVGWLVRSFVGLLLGSLLACLHAWLVTSNVTLCTLCV